MLHIMICKKCNNYTLKEVCQNDNEKTIRAIPLKYSKNESISYARRKLKQIE